MARVPVCGGPAFKQRRRLVMTAYINPAIITWARERTSLTIEDLAYAMKKDPAEIRMWESGDKVPSYASLEELAYQRLKIPLAVFFFPEKPNVPDPVNKFRRLPDTEFARLSPDTLHIMRIAQGYQDSLEQLIGPASSRRKIFRDLTPKGKSPQQLASDTRKYLGITLEQQFGFVGLEAAFKAWRFAVESAGVFTFKDTLKDRFISGFCLLHEYFPIIVVNNSNAFSRQVFTLAHELGHILFGVDGITDADETYIEQMDDPEKALEIKCNQYAAELLVPAVSFQQEMLAFNNQGLDIVPQLADKYSVSREVILRRLLDCDAITKEYYTTKTTEWNADYSRPHGKGGGNWYLTRLSYLGEGFTNLAFDNFQQGRLTKSELARHLNVNARNIDKLQSYLER